MRYDYRQTVSDLMIGQFFEPFVAWNHRNGLQAKLQAHGAPSDLIRSYGLSDIPETENLGAGWDTLDMRFARSAADIYGRRLVSAEALASKDHPFDPTPAWLRRRIDMFFAAGVNAQTLHGYAYVPATSDWPGWYPFAPTPFSTGFGSMLNQQNPVWAAMPTLAGYIARLNAVLRQGSPVVPVALYFGEIGNYHGIEDRGAAAQSHQKALIAGGYDFDRMNADGLLRSRMVGRELVTPGGHRYGALVFPDARALDAAVAEKVAGFAAAGLPVLFTNAAPHRAGGLAEADANDARVRAAVARVVRSGGLIVPQAGLVDALLAKRVAANLRFRVAAEDGSFIERRVGRRRVYFLYNGGEQPRDAGLLLPATGGVQRWDAITGTIAPVSARPVSGGTGIDLALQPHESALLVLDPGTRPRIVPTPAIITALRLPTGGWRLTATGHTTGGAPVSRTVEQASFGDYGALPGMTAFSGEVRYARDIDMPAATVSSGGKMLLNLGEVHDAAIVTVNGVRLPPLIESPWRVDVTRALHVGRNRVEIAVYNTPQNALRSEAPGYSKLTQVPAGLLGPVTLENRR